MNVLFISHVKDSSLANGGAVFSASLVKLIKASFTDSEVTELYCMSANPQFSRVSRKSAALLSSLLSSQSAKSLYFQTAAFSAKLKRSLARTNYDLVVIDHAEMLWCVGQLPASVPIVHVSHNVEHALYRQYVAKYAAWPGIGSLLLRDADKYRRFETQKALQVKNLITISCEDLEFWCSLGADMNVLVLNPAFDYQRTERDGRIPREERLNLGFLGNMEWWPNRSAINWLKEQVLPHLTVPYRLQIFGKRSEEFSDGSTIYGRGFVDQLDEIWQGVDLMVNPIFSGGGVNIKVAEAIYNKMPMLCTSHALKGMDLMPDSSIVLLDTAAEWIQFLNELPGKPELFAGSTFCNCECFSGNRQAAKLKQYLESVTSSTGKCRQ